MNKFIFTFQIQSDSENGYSSLSSTPCIVGVLGVNDDRRRESRQNCSSQTHGRNDFCPIPYGTKPIGVNPRSMQHENLII